MSRRRIRDILDGMPETAFYIDRKRSFYALFAALCAAFVVFVQAASAHALDTSLVVEAVPVGPFELSVWTDSSMVDGPSLHISSLLSDPDTGSPIPAARLAYRIEHIQDGQVFTHESGMATPVNGFLYESDVDLPGAGSYRITVLVNQGQPSGGEVTYIFPVYGSSAMMRIVISVLLTGSLVIVIWLFKEGFTIFIKKRRAL